MKTTITILSLLFIFGSVKGQSTAPEEYQTALNEKLEDIFSTSIIPGISASVYFKDMGEWSGVAGISYDEVAIDTNMLFGMASNTKLFTAVICLKMASHGYFTLEDPISMWIPDFQYVDPNITVKQLLQHNSGLNDFINNTDLFPGQILTNPTKIWTPEETLAYILEPITTPEDGIYYSNANYVLAAMVLESATGLKYNDLLRDSIFEPLGLKDIFIDGFEEINLEMAHPFLFGTDYSETSRTALGTITWAAGAIVTKPSTLTKWYDEVFNQSFLDQDILNQIMDFVEWPEDPEMKMMGLGLYQLNINDRLYYGHGGRTIGYSSYTLFDVENGNSINVATNEFLSDALTIAVALAEKSNELSNTETNVKDLEEEISFYPNPVSHYLTIGKHDHLDIYNAEGKKVLSSNGRSTLSTKSLSAGIYYLKIQKDQKINTHKLVVNH
ncbi:serine hydrolase [Portibacter lacus]|uniref:T9SS C-terminal target domain-containing protein n=1 Tax=Portibacter lacus TaxID=1099794 RepID=A0AA37SMM2_9BACT|nr:serine hydrolase [Portibacter lacus]GLR17558.1 hypothetical protein GCM10007940_21730 [Portibacter lacus]